jgi:hypothetical protein
MPMAWPAVDTDSSRTGVLVSTRYGCGSRGSGGAQPAIIQASVMAQNPRSRPFSAQADIEKLIDVFASHTAVPAERVFELDVPLDRRRVPVGLDGVPDVGVLVGPLGIEDHVDLVSIKGSGRNGDFF